MTLRPNRHERPTAIDSGSTEGFRLCAQDSNCIELTDTVFDRATFDRISVGPALPPDRQIRLIDCRFKSCEVHDAVVFRGGVEIRRVLIDSLKAETAVTISTHALMEHMEFKGRMKGLWVRPDEELDSKKTMQRAAWVAEQSVSVSIGIDLRDAQFDDAEIIGYPPSMIRFDRARFAEVRHGNLKVSELISRGLDPEGFAVEAIRRIKTYRADVGVFSYPSARTRDYGLAVDEIAALDGILRCV